MNTLQTVQLEDKRAIEQIVADSERFQNDPERFTELLAEDVILINFIGIRLFGRDAVYQALKKAVATSLASILTKNEILQITFLCPDVAIMSGIKHITTEATDVSTVTAGQKACLTFVLTKQHNQWRITLIQNTPIQLSQP